MKRLEVYSSGYWCILLSFLLGWVVLLSHNNVLCLLECLLLSGIILPGFFSGRTLGPVSVEYIRRQAQAKTTTQDLIRVRNRSRFAVFSIELGEWREGKFVSLAYLPRLARKSEVIISSHLRFEKRGLHRWNGLAVATSYPFGLFRIIKVIPRADERLVWPESHSVRSLNTDGGISSVNRSGSEYAEGEIRQYVSEDDCRNIIWTLSAKGTEQFVRLRKSSDRESKVVLDLRTEPGVEFERRVIAASDEFYKLQGKDPSSGTLVLIESAGCARTFQGRTQALNRLAVVQAIGESA